MNFRRTIPTECICDRELADLIGMSTHALHLMHPDEFGAPRHFSFAGSSYYYTRDGLKTLASAFRVAGHGRAAGLCEQLSERFSIADAKASDCARQRYWFQEGQMA